VNTDIQFADESQSFQHSQAFQQIKRQAYEHLLAKIESLGGEFGRMSAQAVQRLVASEVERFARTANLPLNKQELSLVLDALTKELSGLGPLQELIDDPDIEDILINGPDVVYVSRHGKLTRSQVRFSDEEHLLRIVRRILAPVGRRLDESSPMVDARLVDGGRVNAIIPPLALDGTTVSIRKFRQDPLTPEKLVTLGSFDRAMLQLLQDAVLARCNILVSGGTSSGKTSLLNALALFMPKHERIITIEDTAELSLNHPHVVRLETRPGGFDGQGQVTGRDLMRNSLRMRPDRVVVGEVRGGEVLEMLQAMNTGHDGSMGTIHASSPRECLYRLEMLAGFAGFQGSELSLRRQIANAIDFIVQVNRLPDGSRRVVSITEVTGVNETTYITQELFKFNDSGSGEVRWVASGLKPLTPKLKPQAVSAAQASTPPRTGLLDEHF
jgi:pilus assembly protein CpaF